ncbi:MAG: hypothetical protein FJ297_05690 [Planctomycetes bacterium]|nr:hypothetical protein [Planctomycetota bacterium]
MGLGDKPRCLDCLAAGLGKSTNPFRDHLNAHFRQRHCYAEVWRRENQREGFASDSLPGCLWSAADPERADDASESSDGRVAVSDEPGVAVFADETWDAGDIACGDLVLGLRHRMSALTPRARLMLVARDPGATEDIPAWCRMTGHALLAQHHPHYWIQRKD